MKNPCYILFTNTNNTEDATINCICVSCHEAKKINGWYWDKGFFQDEEVRCSSCDNLIFKREDNEDKTTI